MIYCNCRLTINMPQNLAEPSNKIDSFQADKKMNFKLLQKQFQAQDVASFEVNHGFFPKSETRFVENLV